MKLITLLIIKSDNTNRLTCRR